MDLDISSRIRNVVMGISIPVMIFLVVLFVYFGSRMVTNQIETRSDILPRIITQTQINSFLTQDFGNMQATVDGLSERGEQLGITYVGMTDETGQMHTSAVADHISEETASQIKQKYLTNLQDDVIIFRKRTVSLPNGTRIIEVTAPVRPARGDRAYGAIRIGFVRSSLFPSWDSYRDRIVVICIVILLIYVIIILLYGLRWRDWIETLVASRENDLRQEYEQKLEEVEEQTTSGPMSSDEFFQIIDFGKKLPKSLEPEDVLRYLVNATVRILNVNQAVVFLVSTDDPNVLRGQIGMKDGDWMNREHLQSNEIEVGSGEIGTIAELGQTNIIDKPEPGSGVAGALRAGGRTIGVLRATEKQSGARMGNKDKLKVRLLCQLSGEVIARAFEFQKFEQEKAVE